jgi:hypothetical protein
MRVGDGVVGVSVLRGRDGRRGVCVVQSPASGSNRSQRVHLFAHCATARRRATGARRGSAAGRSDGCLAQGEGPPPLA